MVAPLAGQECLSKAASELGVPFGPFNVIFPLGSFHSAGLSKITTGIQWALSIPSEGSVLGPRIKSAHRI